MPVDRQNAGSGRTIAIDRPQYKNREMGGRYLRWTGGAVGFCTVLDASAGTGYGFLV